LKAKRSAGDPSKVVVSWENDENLSPVFSHDELMMMAGFPDHYTVSNKRILFLNDQWI
jgi:hypothetical protein